MSEVTLSKAVRQNLSAMQNTAKMMSDTQNRLATGKKVNSALDNPTNFFTASALDSRASDLNSLMDNVGNAVQTLEAADNGIKAIQKLVESAEGTAKQALQAAKGDVTTAGVKGSISGTATTNTVADGETLVFTVDGGSNQTVTFGAGTHGSLDDIATHINSNTTGIVASTDSNGYLQIESENTGEDISIANGTANATDVAMTAGNSSNEVTEVRADSTTRDNLETQFKETLKQIDQLTNDAGFNGNNFLNGDDLKVTFNETGSSSMTVKGIDASASGLGLSDPASKDFQDDAKIEAVLKSLGGAKETLRSSASTFGSNLSTVQTRQDFTSSMIDTLETGAANLTLTDMNQEGANMLALQTRSQLATTALSMASQADQSVLRLL